MLRRRPRVSSPAKIVIVQLDHLGDGVLTTAMLPALRAAYPEARIDVLASPSNEPVFASHPDVDRVLLARRNWFERRGDGWSLLSAVCSLGRLLRRERYDLGFDVRGDLLSVLVLALAGVRRRVGWSMGGGGFLLTDIAAWEPGRHEVESRLALLAALGIQPAMEPRVYIGVSDTDRESVARRFGALRLATLHETGRKPLPTAALQPGALPRSLRVRGRSRVSAHPRGRTLPRSAGTYALPFESAPVDDPDWLHAGRFGEEAPLLAVHLGAGTLAKRWPLRHWHTLIRRFLEEGWRVVIVGGPDEVGLTLDPLKHDRLHDWTGTLRVPETTALLERADLFVGADSGPAHLAACAGTPSIVLFSGTNTVGQWRPWSRRSLVLRHRVACRPCHRKACPLADHPCLGGIAPNRVFRAARRWWSRVNRTELPHAPL
jgi:ADP-heptose:LPS heptosyltransferase